MYKNIFKYIIYGCILLLLFLLIILSVLGRNNRIGYISNFSLNYDDTFILNNIVDENIISNSIDIKSNFIVTNQYITNYIYSYKLNYYSKFFRHSDIFAVYIDDNSILSHNPFIIKVISDKNGSPFGSIISSRTITYDKIDNVIYNLKIRKSVILYFLLVISICFIKHLYSFFIFITKTIYCFIFIKNYSNFRKIFILFLVFIIIIFFIILYVSNKERVANLYNFDLNSNLTLGINNITNSFIVTNSYEFKKEYIETNTIISNYVYSVKINYYTKFFRDNNIFSIYINTKNIYSLDNIKLKIDYNATNSEYIVSDKILTKEDTINIDYKLKLKLRIKIILIVFILFTFLFIIYYLFSEDIINLRKINLNINLFKYIPITLKILILLFSISLISLIMIKLLLKNNINIGSLSNLELNIEDTLYLNNSLVDIYYDRYHSVKNLHNIYYSWNNIDTNIFTDSFIYTNNKITNYVYNFSLLDDSFLYKLNFLYDITFNVKDILNSYNYISNIKQYSKGGFFGTFTSEKKLSTIKTLDNISYSMSIKRSIFILNTIILGILLLIYILYINYSSILLFLIKIQKRTFDKVLILLLLFIIFISLLLYLPAKKEYNACLEDFNLMINTTLEFNGIDLNLNDIWIYSNVLTTNSLFTYNLQEEFIYTNNLITNYYYYYNLIPKNKIFNNNIIYDIDNINILDNIDVKLVYNNNSGYLISTNKLYDGIINISYKLKIKNTYLNFICFIIFIILTYLIIFNHKNISNYIINIDKEIYNTIIIVTSFIIFIFEFWLLFPGYFVHYDEMWMMAKAVYLNYDNWYPAIIQVFLTSLYQIFGYKTFYIFLLNLICWYTGITLITIALYKKYLNKKVILLLFISLLPDIFFNSFLQLKDITATLLVWLFYSIIFYKSIININRKLNIIMNIFVGLLLILSIVWRHNFIVTIYPMCIFFTYRILKNIKISNMKNYFFYFVTIMFIFGFSFVIVSKLNSYLLVRNKNEIEFSKDATTHLFMLQIIGTASRANDGSLIPEDWYYKGKTFDDVKLLYFNAPTSGDVYRHPPTSPLKFYNLKDLKKIWILYIFKHPISYFEHVINFVSYSFFAEPWLFDSKDVQNKSYAFIGDKIFDNNGITFSKLRYHIYSFLFKHFSRMYINIFFYIILSFILFIINIYLLVSNKNKITDIQVFSIVTSISSLVTIIIVSLFAPAIIFRYFFPIIPINILSLISLLIVFNNRKNIT